MVPIRKRLNWLSAVSLAVVSHVLVAFAFANLSRSSAEGDGEFGIEIGIGFLGDAGLSNQNTDASEAQPEPPADVLEPEPELESEIEPMPELELPLFEPLPQLEQDVETVVQAMPEIDVPEPIFESREQLIEAIVDMVNRNESALQRTRTTGLGDTDSAGGYGGIRATYIDRLFAKLNRHKHYPLAARRGPDEGTATLHLLLRNDGYVMDAYVAKSSGFGVLDAAAMRMLEMAKPLPPFPPEIKSKTLRVRIPVKFEISDN